MTNLATQYLGLHLKNPVIASSSPLNVHVDNLQKLEEAGAAAIVLPSLFEEQIQLQEMGYDLPSLFEPSALPDELQHIPNMAEYNRGANGYLALIYQAKKAVSIPIIASLNGYYSGGWIRYARLLEASGADALELNIYYMASKPHITAAEIEDMYLKLVQNVRASIKIPVAVKIGPYFTAMTHMATRLDQAGADGLVLFNRFYQPDFDLDTEKVVPTLELSTSPELRLRLRWTAIISQYVAADLAITGGVHTAVDILKGILAGATVVMMTSALLNHGIDYLAQVLADLETLMKRYDFDSIAAVRGRMNQQHVAEPSVFERANYMNIILSMME